MRAPSAAVALRGSALLGLVPLAVFVAAMAYASAQVSIAGAIVLRGTVESTAAPVAVQAAEPNQLRHLRLGSHADQTHVVIEADGPFCTDIALQDRPFRLSIDLPELAGPRPALPPRAWWPGPPGSAPARRPRPTACCST